MPRFWGFISNGTYCVGCTGQTVYVYDQTGNELAKFKDIKYGYHPLFFPDGDRFLVKSTEGRLAIYSLSEMKLIKKFRFSKVNGAQDDNMDFSPDGSLFYNVEGHPHPTDYHSSNFGIGIYETGNFKRVKLLFADDPIIHPHGLQWDAETETLYVLGKDRSVDNFSHFIAILEDDKLHDLYYISEQDADFYLGYLHTSGMGFTKLSKEWSPLKYTGYDLDKVEKETHSLSELWLKYALQSKFQDPMR
jgi:WD40 repeat protein